jgi:hypothetical protein
MKINKDNHKIVLWGWKENNNTFYYIHYAFHKAFKYLGYETHWMDNNTNTNGFDFTNTLFFTEGQVDQKIPINTFSKYVLHNCDGSKYKEIDSKNKVNLQFFHKDVLGYATTKINDYTYVGHDIIYQPWATDLLPHEFSENDAHNELNNRECVWIGSYSPDDHTAFENNTELDPFFNQCRKNNIRIKLVNPWVSPCSQQDNRNIVRNAFLAPSINGAFQKKTFYLSCRVFKNISYGHLGITNNNYVNAIFDNKLVYDPDTSVLFQKALEKKNSPNVIDEIKFAINEVREKHTYLNRIKIILDFFEDR